MVRFTKMEGLGNDYIYVDNIAERLPEADLPALSQAVSDRHFGIGADGLIAILPADDGTHDFRFRVFNADGSEGEMCGNGIRCFARLVYERGLTDKTEILVDTRAGTIIPHLVLDDQGRVQGVRVDMGLPRLSSGEIPMAGPHRDRVLGETLTAGGETYTYSAVSMGNPHLISFDREPETVDLAAVGPGLEHHPLFPRRINVHFARAEAPDRIRMRTWERGSGITLACGTGACAVLVAAHLNGLTGRKATLALPGGELTVEWTEAGRVYMTGPAHEVCTGVFTRPWR